jgi:hypothetical protein
MIDPARPKDNCPHCKSSEMEYLGFTFGGFHFYYKCLSCQKYTEYCITLKNYLIMSFIILLMMLFSIAIPLSVFNKHVGLAIIIICLAFDLFWMFGYKYRFYFYELIALDELQIDLKIIHAFSKRIRLIIVVIIISVFLAYAGIFTFNLLRQ